MSDPSSSTSAKSKEIAVPKEIKVRCSDGKLLVIEDFIIRDSKVLMESLEYANFDTEEIELALKSDGIETMIEFAEFFKNDGPYTPPKNHQDFGPLRREPADPAMVFLHDLLPAELDDFISALAFFAIPRLVDFMCNNILQRLEGRDTDGLREEYLLPNDYSSSEEYEIRRRHEV
uniref:Skp1 domain-containing protein n=1 Tax=Panagrellus redivivus TaxID=6233 RepID=A0A7E4VIT6_PANRE